MGDSNDPYAPIKLPMLVDISGDGSKVVLQHSHLHYVNTVAKELTEHEFGRIENSSLNPIVKIGRRKGLQFSGKLFHFLMQRRVKLKGNVMWFTFASQPMRFSEREFLLTTGLPFSIQENLPPMDLQRVETPYSWMISGKETLKDLIAILQNKDKPKTECERLSLASVILVEGILRGVSPSKKIPCLRLKESLNFEDYSRKPWGRIGFDLLRSNILKLTSQKWIKDQYDMEGFVWAINFWALCSVPHLGIRFGKEISTCFSEDPLMLKWISTEAPRVNDILDVEKINNVMVKTIVGDPEKHNDLVPETHVEDNDFMEIVDMVKKGYRLKAADWSNGFVDVLDATEAIDYEHMKKDLGISQKLDMLMQMVGQVNKKVDYIEKLLLSELKKREDTKNEEFQNDDNSGDVDPAREDFADEGDAARENLAEEENQAKEDPAREDLVDGDIPSTYEDSIRDPNTQDGSYAGDDERTQGSGRQDENTEDGDEDVNRDAGEDCATEKQTEVMKEDESLGKEEEIRLGGNEPTEAEISGKEATWTETQKLTNEDENSAKEEEPIRTDTWTSTEKLTNEEENSLKEDEAIRTNTWTSTEKIVVEDVSDSQRSQDVRTGPRNCKENNAEELNEVVMENDSKLQSSRDSGTCSRNSMNKYQRKRRNAEGQKKDVDAAEPLKKKTKYQVMHFHDLTKLCEENIGDMRRKLAADIFSELQKQ